MMYIIVEPQGLLSSELRANIISHELYNVICPTAIREDKTPKLYCMIIKHQTSDLYALEFDPVHALKVHPQATLERLVSAFPEVSETERMMLQQYIYTSESFLITDIMPSTARTRTEEEMEELGWFEELI